MVTNEKVTAYDDLCERSSQDNLDIGVQILIVNRLRLFREARNRAYIQLRHFRNKVVHVLYKPTFNKRSEAYQLTYQQATHDNLTGPCLHHHRLG